MYRNGAVVLGTTSLFSPCINAMVFAIPALLAAASQTFSSYQGSSLYIYCICHERACYASKDGLQQQL